MLGVALCYTPLWNILRHGSTFIHEMAHAMCAVILGGRVERIVYNPDASGLATFRLPRSFGRLRSIIAAGAGYLGPPLAGLIGVIGILSEKSSIWVVGGATLSALAFILFVRNLWGWLYTFVFAAGLLTLYFRASWGLNWLAAVWAGALLGGGMRGAFIQCQAGDLTGSDAGEIGRLVYLPGKFIAWVQFLFGVLIAAGAVYIASGM